MEDICYKWRENIVSIRQENIVAVRGREHGTP